MSYPYVQSATDLGPAKGPRLAMIWHMAEGGGTVAFLSKPNIRGVSVHFVIEYDGTIVQMLQLDHMHSSINPNQIRSGDDPNGLYGRSDALAVMGKWADISHGTLGPNHASIAVEIEGFAKDGPNAKETVAIRQLAAYVGIPEHLGHRDFQDYKACPGQHFPWDVLGGHGEKQGDPDMAQLPITDQTPAIITLTDPATYYNLDGSVQSGGHNLNGATQVSPYASYAPNAHFRSMYAGKTGAARLVLVKPATVTPIPPSGDTTHSVTLTIDGTEAYKGDI